MRKYLLVAASLAMLLTIATTSVLAQEGIGVPYGEPRPPNLPDYIFEEDGTVIFQGDQSFDCRSFALAREDGYFQDGNQRQALKVLQQCKEGGFLEQGDQQELPETVYSSEAEQALPDTGGPSGIALLLPAAGLLLITSLAGLKMIGRHS